MRLTSLPFLVLTVLLTLPPSLRAADPPPPPAPARPVVIYIKDQPPASPTLYSLPLKESITQRGITWTFDQPAHVGQFFNGDWYVVGPVTIKAIDPRPLFGEEVKDAPETQDKCTEKLYPGAYARNGSTLNLPAAVPPTKVTPRTARSGFDSRMPMAAYDENQFTKLPIALKPGDALASSISAEKYDGSPIKAVAILTCVAAPQPPDAFRPSFCKTSDCKPYLARNLRRDLLLKLPLPPAAAKVKPTDCVDYFQGVWIDTVGFGRAMPRKSFYGPQIAEAGGGGSLLLLLDYPPEQKEPLLLHMVQVGIDLFGLLRGGAEWHGEGGGNAGRKWLITFAGLMLDDPQMHSLTKSFPEGRFHEDEQTAFCPLVYNGKTYTAGWTGAKVVWTGHYPYYKGQFRPDKGVLSHYGPTELFHPADWPTPWPEGSEAYRRGMTSAAWVAQALAARLLHAEKNWDHDAFFAYVDRWMTEDDTPFIAEMLRNVDTKLAAAKTDEEKKVLEAAKTKIDKSNRSGAITGRAEMIPIVRALWNTYRNNLPPSPDGPKTPPAEKTWK